jgi:hypothetical protein
MPSPKARAKARPPSPRRRKGRPEAHEQEGGSPQQKAREHMIEEENLAMIEFSIADHVPDASH